MDDVQRVVTTYIATSAAEIPVELVSSIESDEVALLVLVKALGEYLTTTDDAVRARAVGLLSGVLGKISPGKINRQSTRVLTTFYCDKLDDVYILGPALQGLCVLAALPTFGTGETGLVCQAIFDRIKMRSMVQSLRFLVFKIIDILMANHRDALKKLGTSFIGNYCRLADGEKDPRNLLIAFSIARVILIEFELGDQVDELFDCTFCYFPITYKPPPNDPYGISTEDLRTALRACLSGTPLFSKAAMPLFLDKMAASGGEMKKDTLRTLAACLPVYGQDNAIAFAVETWEALKVEALFTSDDSIEAETLKTLAVFLNTLYPSLEVPPTGIIVSIVKECLEILKEPEKSKAKPATRILAACFSASPSIGPYTYSQAFPHLLRLFHKTEELSQRGPILESIAILLQSAKELYARPESGRTLKADKALITLRDEILGVLNAGIKTSNFRRPALDGYMQVVQIEGLLSPEEIGFVVQNINDLILEEGEELRSPALAGLAIISKIAPKSLEEITLPLLFSKLPDSPPPLEAEEDRTRYRRILSSLTVLCVQPPLFEILVVRVTSKLDILCSPRSDTVDSSMDATTRETEAVYAYALLNCLLSVLRTKAEAGHSDIAKYIDQLVPRLLTIFVLAALSPYAESEIAADPRLVIVASRVVEAVVQTLSAERQTKFAQTLFAAYRQGEVAAIVHQPSRLPASPRFDPLAVETSTQQKNLILFFTSGLTALRPQVELPETDLSTFLLSILKWAMDLASNHIQTKALFHLFASLINKRAESANIFLSQAAQAFWSAEVVGPSSSPARRSRAITAWVWLCRGLLVRNHELGFKFLGQMFDELFVNEQDDTLAQQAARALTVISEGDGEGVMSKKNHAVIRLLHKQKFFNFVLPKIVEGYTINQGSPRQNIYLVALASIIKIIPRSLCVSDLPTLLPLLLRCLDLPDPDLKANVMDIFLTVAEVDDATTAEVIENQAPRIVEGLLRGLVKKNSSERSRSSALRTLAVFPDVVRYDVLHPIKPAVLRELGQALDDPRRTVRREAVDARAKWFLFHG